MPLAPDPAARRPRAHVHREHCLSRRRHSLYYRPNIGRTVSADAVSCFLVFELRRTRMAWISEWEAQVREEEAQVSWRTEVRVEIRLRVRQLPHHLMDQLCPHGHGSRPVRCT
jgi:hypothetical protein